LLTPSIYLLVTRCGNAARLSRAIWIGSHRGNPELQRLDVSKSIIRTRQIILISTVLVSALVLAALAGIWVLRQGAIMDAEDDNHRLGVVIAEQTARTFQAADLVLQEIAGKIVSARVHDATTLHDTFGGQDMHEALAKRLADLPQAGSFVILDADGKYVNQSRQFPVAAYSLADRAYFQHFVTTLDAGPYITEPLASRANTGVPTVMLVRRVTASDGTFLGVVFAGIQLRYFDDLFARTGFSEGTGITILRDDGVFLVHYPTSTGLSGSTMPAQSQWYQTLRSGGGHYLSRGIFDDQGARLVSVHPIGDYPIVVDVIREESAALARWRGQASAIGGGVVLSAICFGLLLSALRRQIASVEASQDHIRNQVATVLESEAHLAVQSALLETTLEHMNQGLMMIDASGVVAVCNRRVMELLELPAEMMTARPRLSDVIEFQRRRGEFDGPPDNEFDFAMAASSHAMYERRRPNGTNIEVRSTPLPNGGMVRTFTDITARSAAEDMLAHAASHDQLTGLVNRTGLIGRRDAAIATARLNSSPLAVLCLDLDRFKTVNDTLGHEVGDALLVQVSQRIRELARSTDVVARLGGDEFLMIVQNAGLVGAEQISRRLLDAIRLPYQIGRHEVLIGLSIGIAIFPGDGATAEELLRNADTALYKAKAAGRDTWRAYASEDGRRQQDRIALELDFRAAVANRQLTLAYQPICEAATSTPVAFEALLRWNHPTRGEISPVEFIPLAEQTGLIIPLGLWVIETACAEAATWAVPLRIAVNLSPAQFHERELVSSIREVLARTGLSPRRLELEVTEGLLIDDLDDVVKTMNELRGMGIRMVLDDFGTAHSNLSYLRGLPFEAVKIDRGFMRALNTDRQARALVEAILAMAKALGLEVVGEGVETQEQLALLCHLQCRFVQGYLLGRPAPAAETRNRIWQLATGSVMPEYAQLPAA
jgi:diguanylate cyclase (GGDEF)-like protein